MMGQMQRNHFTQGINKLGLLADMTTSWQTGTSLQWLAPHNKKVLGSDLRIGHPVRAQVFPCH